jgi:MYXO-CTERM domain-containing protein
MNLKRVITVTVLLLAGSLAAYADELLMPLGGQFDVAAICAAPSTAPGDAAGWVAPEAPSDGEGAALLQTAQTSAPDSYGVTAYAEPGQTQYALAFFEPACVTTPEPASLLLAAAGVAFLAAFRKRRA